MSNVKILLIIVSSIVLITVAGIFAIHEHSNAKEACEAVGGKLVRFKHERACMNPNMFIKVN